MAKTNQNHRETFVKLVSECFVKPKHEIEASKTPYHLGPGDLIMLSIDPIQKGLLFTLNNIDTHRTKAISHLLDNLKHSLSIALVYFYPLAGRFTTQVHENDNTSTIFVDCNKGPGARFIHASALDVSVDDVLSPIDVSIALPFFDLGEKMVNYDGHTKALVSIQVTELLDGVFIGFSMNHSVVDGTSFLHFVNTLAEIYRSLDEGNLGKTKQISRMPIFNYRPWLSCDVNNKDCAGLEFPSLDVGKEICRGYDPGLLRDRIFHFSRSSMSKLKAMANQECGTQNVISSFQALTAFVWKSITKVRNLPLDQQTTCFLAVGARARLDPPVLDDYFGNLVSKVDWTCNVKELLGNGPGWAAMNIQKHLKAHDAKAILDFYKEFTNPPQMIPRGLYPNPLGETGIVMGGSARFDIYGPEFGLGRALAARMGYGNKEDGKITANPGYEGGGSVDLEISLRPHIMAALEADEEFMSFVSN